MEENSEEGPDEDNDSNPDVAFTTVTSSAAARQVVDGEEWILDAYDPPSSAVIWIAWLIGQILVSCLLLMLSGFHFGLVKPELCDEVTTVSSNTSNSTIGSPTCAFSGSVLALAILSCIVSVIDAARTLPYLKSILQPEKSQDQITNVEAERLRGCFSSNKCLSFNIVRVWYCWILVHSILITVAANTYEWSWETDELSVLVNSATFFLTCTVYILIIIAMVTWLISCCCSEKTKERCEQREQQGTAGIREQQGTAGNREQHGTAGNREQHGTAGNREQHRTAGNREQHGTAGNREQHRTAGNREQHGTAGNREQQGTAGNREQHGTVGNREQHGTAGNREQHRTAGNREQHGTAGNREQQGTAGNREQQGTAGNREQQGTVGNRDEQGTAGNRGTVDQQEREQNGHQQQGTEGNGDQQ